MFLAKVRLVFPIIHTQIRHTSVSFLLIETNGNNTTLLTTSPPCFFFLGYFQNWLRENDLCILPESCCCFFPFFLWTARGVSRCRLSRAISHRFRQESWLKWPFVTCSDSRTQKSIFPRDKKKKSCFVFVSSFLTLFTSGVFSPHHRLQRHLESHLYHRKCPVHKCHLSSILSKLTL